MGMENHFDTGGVFEISKFEISQLACSCICLQAYNITLEYNIHDKEEY